MAHAKAKHGKGANGIFAIIWLPFTFTAHLLVFPIQAILWFLINLVGDSIKRQKLLDKQPELAYAIPQPWFFTPWVMRHKWITKKIKYLKKARYVLCDYFSWPRSHGSKWKCKATSQSASLSLVLRAAGRAEDELLEAAEHGNVAKVRQLLDGGVNVNAKDNNGFTALHHAAKNGHVEMVVALVKAGVEADAKNNNGCTALHHAAYKGHVEMVVPLVNAGVEANTKDNNGFTALHCAALAGHVEMVVALVKAGVEANAKTNNGLTALHYAADNGHVEMAVALVNAGVEISIRDNNGKTALDLATEYRRMDVVAVLQTAAEARAVAMKVKGALEVLKAAPRKDGPIALSVQTAETALELELPGDASVAECLGNAMEQAGVPLSEFDSAQLLLGGEPLDIAGTLAQNGAEDGATMSLTAGASGQIQLLLVLARQAAADAATTSREVANATAAVGQVDRRMTAD